MSERTDHPTVAVIVLNWNGASDTLACVESLLALQGPRPLLVVADNDSRPDDVERLRTGLRTLDPQLEERSVGDTSPVGPHSRTFLLKTGGNLGFAGGNNRGWDLARSVADHDFYWFLNNDTIVEPGALQALVQRSLRDPSIGICGSTLVYLKDRRTIQAWGGSAYFPRTAASKAMGYNRDVSETPTDPSEVESGLGYVVGASMLVSRRYMETVGPMDESYFLYSEEHDWAERGKPSFRLGWAPDSIVYHIHGATIGSDPAGGSPFSVYYLYRNKLRFTWKFYRKYTPFVLTAVMWRAVKHLLKGRLRISVAIIQGTIGFAKVTIFRS